MPKKGCKPSPESIAKMVATRKANGTYVPTEELRKKWSEIRKGRKRDPKVSIKITATKMARGTNKHTKEAKMKMSLSHTGKKLSETTRQKLIGKRVGEKNHKWKGDDVGYSGLHSWVKRNKPKPEDGLCEHCHIEKFYDTANISGKYLRDIKDYWFLCHKCHVKYDMKVKKSLSSAGVPPPYLRSSVTRQFLAKNPLYKKVFALCPNCNKYSLKPIGIRNVKDIYNINNNKRYCSICNYIHVANLVVSTNKVSDAAIEGRILLKDEKKIY